jgi:flagellar transcriptional activator FlhC
VRSRGDRHLQAVRLARELALLGARLKTIHAVTGLPPRQVQSLFFPDGLTIPRGRAPDSVEWFHGANLILRADACLLGVKYEQLRQQGLAAGDALLCAYRAYQCVTRTPSRISMDRAFNVASYLDGIWLAREPALSVSHCRHCGCAHLTAIGTPAVHSNGCPFCRLLERFHHDPRLQVAYRDRSRPLPIDADRLKAWPQAPQRRAA